MVEKRAPRVKGWVGVDLDGTLVFYDKWRGELHLGEPIWPMVERIKKILADGQYDVRIFTARVSTGTPAEIAVIAKNIQYYLEDRCKLPRLEVTCVKDYAMVLLYDDRCRQVIHNMGVVIGEP